MFLAALMQVPAPSSASQLFFTSADGCARSVVGFDSSFFSASSGANLQARVNSVMNQLDSVLESPPLSCPTVGVAPPSRIEGVVSFDFASQRLFDISTSYVFGPAGVLPSGSASFVSALRITDYSSASASQISLALDPSDDVLTMQFQPSSGKLVAIVRNSTPTIPTLGLFKLDPSAPSGAIKALMMDLTAALGSASIVSGMSALDTAGTQRLLFATMVITAGSAPQFSIVSLDLTALSVASHSLGPSQIAIEGMAWMPQLSALVLVSYEGAALYDPTTQVRTPLNSVSSALSAISSASASGSSSMQAAAYLSAHLWQARSSVAPVGSTPLVYADLLPSGLVSLLVQSAPAVAPMLLLIDAANDQVRIEAAPRSRATIGVGASGISAAVGELLGLTALAATPTGVTISPRTNLSAAGDTIIINGTQLYSLPRLAGATVQCEWSELSGVTKRVAGTMLTPSSARCVLPAIPRPNTLMEMWLRVANESTSAGIIDVNQCLASNGGCPSPSLCVHSYGLNLASGSRVLTLPMHPVCASRGTHQPRGTLMGATRACRPRLSPLLDSKHALSAPRTLPPLQPPPRASAVAVSAASTPRAAATRWSATYWTRRPRMCLYS